MHDNRMLLWEANENATWAEGMVISIPEIVYYRTLTIDIGATGFPGSLIGNQIRGGGIFPHPVNGLMMAYGVFAEVIDMNNVVLRTCQAVTMHPGGNNSPYSKQTVTRIWGIN